MIDTILTLDNKLEALDDRNLDEINCLAELDSEKLIQLKFEDDKILEGISFDDIKEYLKGGLKR